MNTHNLKIVQPFFDSVLEETKTFEVRKNDRGYQVGDILNLCLYDHYKSCYLGPEIKVRVLYITGFEQKEGFIVMGIKKLT